MKWVDFEELKLQDKIKELYENGTFIVAIRYYKYKINLYQLENYFVEVFFNHKKDQIERIEKLELKTSRMKFYCDQIKIAV